MNSQNPIFGPFRSFLEQKDFFGRMRLNWNQAEVVTHNFILLSNIIEKFNVQTDGRKDRPKDVQTLVYRPLRLAPAVQK